MFKNSLMIGYVVSLRNATTTIHTYIIPPGGGFFLFFFECFYCSRDISINTLIYIEYVCIYVYKYLYVHIYTHLYIDSVLQIQTYKQTLILVMPANNKEKQFISENFFKNFQFSNESKRVKVVDGLPSIAWRFLNFDFLREF